MISLWIRKEKMLCLSQKNSISKSPKIPVILLNASNSGCFSPKTVYTCTHNEQFLCYFSFCSLFLLLLRRDVGLEILAAPGSKQNPQIPYLLLLRDIQEPDSK